ncbi:hypothetical protein C8F01DRAFT_433170 [Mycena amicta]|nr:hypothetical protein C8F01DRAFT_433170 [Mycena amicta]
MPSLAAELWLIEIFPRLAFVALIRCRCVCQTWRQLVLHADVSPIRRSLYELYLDVIDSDGFLPSRQRVLSQLQPFDRKGYIAALRSQTHAFIPPEFELYILEWPEKAILYPIWPGLPLDQDATNWSAGICRGINHTATIPPLLYKLQVDFDCIDSHVAAADVLDKMGSYDLLSFPGLPLWQRRSGTIFWLCFAQTPFSSLLRPSFRRVRYRNRNRRRVESLRELDRPS